MRFLFIIIEYLYFMRYELLVFAAFTYHVPKISMCSSFRNVLFILELTPALQVAICFKQSTKHVCALVLK